MTARERGDGREREREKPREMLCIISPNLNKRNEISTAYISVTCACLRDNYRVRYFVAR